jgi:acylphosphatase
MADCRGFRVFGRVQGVWFRESTRQQAHRLAITGHAINCPDGSVEVVAFGSGEAISELLDWLRQGPEMARVERVEEFPAPNGSPDDFVTG